jgi:hypothetical protein
MQLPRISSIRNGMTLVAVGFLVSLAAPYDSEAQVIAARRMSMGGVVISHGGEGIAQNVAYRAVPSENQPTSLPLPLGLVQYAINPPTFNPNNPDFNALELANDLLNPPWHIQIYEPSTPSSDVLVEVSRNSLVIDLDDIQRAIPSENLEHGGVLRFPGLMFGVGPVFGGVTSFSHVSHTLNLAPELHGALTEAEPFLPGRSYDASDAGVAQALMAVVGGAAFPIISPPAGDPYESSELALYGGVRLKYLRGIGYLDATNNIAFTTNDTLFGANPVDVDYEGVAHYTGSDDFFSGSGFGLDLGGVLFYKRVEFGFGINDLVHQVTWTVDVDTFRFNPTINDIEVIPGPEDIKRDGQFPVTWYLTSAVRPGAWTVAGTLAKNVGSVTVHAGVERWLGRVALRGGTTLDNRQLLQFSVGSGLRFAGVGFDLGLATHSRTITEERGLEMGVSFVLY